jgi:hypothetical protein
MHRRGESHDRHDVSDYRIGGDMTDKFAAKLGAIIGTIIIVSFWIGSVYVAIHFIRKFW